jgi:hypothetical protein
MSDVHNGGELAFAVVSDGCSSGRNTDVGARLLVLATAQVVREYWAATQEITLYSTLAVLAKRQDRVREVQSLLGMTQDDMLATSMFVCVSQCCGLVRVQGDGVVALKYRDGSIVMTRYEWPQNAPFYPTYLVEGIDAFVEFQGGDVDAKVVRACSWAINSEGIYTKVSSDLHSIATGIRGFHTFFNIGDEVEYVAIFTDGVTQIENVDWKDAVRSFMGFKTTAGEFAKRRMITGIKETQKVGKGPMDDISYAVIHIKKDSADGGVS